MRGFARDAAEMATPFDLPGILNNEEFIKVCAQLSEDNEEEKKGNRKKEKLGPVSSYTLRLARIHAAITCHTGRKGCLHPTWWPC